MKEPTAEKMKELPTVEEMEKLLKEALDEAFKEALERFPPGNFSSRNDSNMALSLLQVFYFSMERRLGLEVDNEATNS